MSTPPPGDGPIFILGAGRSGTTLMQSLLSAHGRIAVTPETHFCAIWEQRTGRPVADPAACFEAGWRGYLASRRFADLGLTPEEARAVLERGPERTARTALAALMTAYGEAQGKPRVGEKTPGHWRHARTLLDWFPEARVIVMRRDPRAVAASKMRAPWAAQAMRFAGTSLARATRLHVVAEEARHWLRIYREAMPPLLAGPRATQVAYEELAREPEAVTRRVCAFLGEAFEPTMLGDRSAQAAADGGGTEAQWDGWRAGHLAAARRPVGQESIERWRAELAPREVAAIEAVAGEAMEEAGYALASGAPERRSAARLARAAMAAGEAELAARRAAGLAKRRAGGLLRGGPR